MSFNSPNSVQKLDQYHVFVQVTMPVCALALNELKLHRHTKIVCKICQLFIVDTSSVVTTSQRLIGMRRAPYFYFVYLQQWKEALTHPESRCHILFDSCTRTPQSPLILSLIQSIFFVLLHQTDVFLAMPAYPCTHPILHLQNSEQKLINFFHGHQFIPLEKKKTAAEISLLFFFLVMVPATCLLFIFSIT